MKFKDLSVNNLVFVSFNLLLLLIGIAYVGIGCWLIDSLKNKPNIDLIDNYYTSMGGIMITIGSLCVINTFIGCILLLRKGLFICVFYLIALVFLFLFGISIGIVGFGFAATTNTKLSDSVNRNLFLQSDTMPLIDRIQQSYKCCGLNSSADWTDWINKPSLPASCCIYNIPGCKKTDFFQVGCFSTMSNSILNDMLISGAISLAIALPIIIGMITTFALIIELLEGNIKYQLT